MLHRGRDEDNTPPTADVGTRRKPIIIYLSLHQRDGKILHLDAS